MRARRVPARRVHVHGCLEVEPAALQQRLGLLSAPLEFRGVEGVEDLRRRAVERWRLVRVQLGQHDRGHAVVRAQPRLLPLRAEAL